MAYASIREKRGNRTCGIWEKGARGRRVLREAANSGIEGGTAGTACVAICQKQVTKNQRQAVTKASGKRGDRIEFKLDLSGKSSGGTWPYQFILFNIH